MILMALYFYVTKPDLDTFPASLQGVALTEPVTLSTFMLLDQNSKGIGLDELGGHWTFLFFGYTSCPDVCPATLSQLVVINKKIRQAEGSVPTPQFYFVSVDPQRDTPEFLQKYLKYFDESFIGLTGEMAQLVAFEKQFNVFHKYGKKRDDGFYTVAHSADTFLIDPGGRIVAKFQPPMEIELVVDQYMDLVKRSPMKISS